MFLRRALRYRLSQTLVLAGVSLLIGTCAAFAPWFARAVEQTVTTEALIKQRLSAAWQLESRPPPSSQGVAEAALPEDLDQLLPADVRGIIEPPVHGMTVNLDYRVVGNPDPIAGRLIWRDGACRQLVLEKGRCPRAKNEVVASDADEKNYGSTVGAVIKAKTSRYAGGGTLRVVGVYHPADPAAPYWFGRPPTGHSFPGVDPAPSAADYLIAERVTFASSVWGQNSTSDTAPLAGVVRIEDLAHLKSVTLGMDAQAVELNLNAVNSSGLPGVVDAIEAERHQAATIIPLVMVQVALFGVVVLALAMAAVVDQRTPELAVARLRGLGLRRTGRALALELSIPVLVGTIAGGLAGFGLLLLVRATWLDDGAPLELPWTVPAAVGAAVLAGLAVVLWAVNAVVRQPISTLLRRIAPRRSGRGLSMVDLSIIVLASAGLVAALTADGRGPLPVLTPTLLALAVGLAFAHLLLPTAGLVSRRALRNGRLGLALGALQVSRRPAVTRIVAVVAVATSLVSFAGQAASVAGHNRELRAGYETGAEGVLTLQTSDLGGFTRAIDKVDPERHWLTPVVLAFPPSPRALTSMMIEPDSFRRIAFGVDGLIDDEGLQALRAPAGPVGIDLRGERLTLTASTGPMKEVKATTFDGQEAAPEPPGRSVVLQASVVSARNGVRYVVQFPPLPLVPGKSVELTAPIDCQASCRLLRLGVSRELGDIGGIQGEVTLSKLATDTQPSIALGRGEDWPAIRGAVGDNEGGVTARTGPDDGLTLELTSLGSELYLQHASVPSPVPALVTPDFQPGEATTIPAPDGIAIPIRQIDGLRGPVPRYSQQTAVIDLDNARRLGGTPDDNVTDFQVWLNADGLANSDKIIDGFRDTGIAAALTDRRSDRIDSYARSASALALQLTPVVGVAGWSLAIIVLLLMVVTSWRSRAQDYASLRITGVPAGTTGSAARWEQTGPVALAALLGSACGIAGAQIALPLIPLFAQTTQPSPIPLELSTNWGVALALWLIGTLVLTTTTLLLGTGVNRRSDYGRIREELA
ncbi:MAG TPA: FtsX-like permease family protein [Kribbella sp.]|nr:FtsX-like permease family protein [Kribbella sp.]